MEMKPLLAIVTLNEVVNDYICQSIKNVIGHLIDVEGYSQDRKNFFERVPDLVLTSGPYCDELADRVFPGIYRITAFRILAGESLEQVLAIPAGKHVLVISNLREIAQESIDLLQQAGIGHINYHCWWSGQEINPSKYEYAITPNVQHLCPYSFKHMINLGIRGLSIRTFFQILQFFHLDPRYADSFENRYLKKNVNTSRKIMRVLSDAEQFRHGQAVLLNEVDEGLISVDGSGTLLAYNSAAQNIFGPEAGVLESPEFKQMAGILEKEPVREVPGFHSAVWRTAEVLTSVDKHDILCRKSIFYINGMDHTLYTVHRTEQIKKREESIRKKNHGRNAHLRYTFHDIWGQNPQILRLKERAKTFSATEQTILIVGESGTGKEMLAQSIHRASLRKNGPFVGINLASMSQSLIASELFGYTEGAFTGAQKGGKAGLFEAAEGGTIFLDEIGDAPLSIQVALLRVLEERVITRVGGYRPIPIDVRIVAATNRPLQDMVKTGGFRSDLYYRLNVLSLQTLPLREMRDEVIGFLKQHIQDLYGGQVSFSSEAARLLERYLWPGNFREMKNLAEYLHCVCGDRAHVTEADLPEYLLEEIGAPMQKQRQTATDMERLCQSEPVLLEILQTLQAAAPRGIGRGTILAALAASGRRVSEGKLKHDMELLKKNGLVYSGNTKQGSFLTAEGAAFMEGREEPEKDNAHK